MQRFMMLASAVAYAGCGGGGSDPSLEALVRLSPVTSASGVSIAARVQAFINREDADKCRFDMDTTTFEVTQGGQTVDGFLVFFVDGRRVDFTPNGLFDFATTYDVEVTVPCSLPSTTSFTTVGDIGGPVTIAADDAIKVDSLTVSEPQAIAPLLRGFLDDAQVIVAVLGYTASELRMLGGEGEEVTDIAFPGLRAYVTNPFLFPMVGTFKWPYFQVVGGLEVEVNTGVFILLEPFEIAGRFGGSSPSAYVTEGVIRASALCDDVCAVDAPELQLVCANRSTICDQAGYLNLVGSYEGPANDLRPYQVIGVTPSDGAVDVLTTAGVDLTFDRAVNDQANRPVVLEVRDSTGALVDGTLTVDAGGASASFAPTAALSTNSTYTVMVVALGFSETMFTTGAN